MKKVAFYQIQDGDTGAQVAQGLQGNFEALQQEIEAIPSYFLPIKMADLGLDAKEDLNVVVMTDNNTWREELVAENN